MAQEDNTLDKLAKNPYYKPSDKQRKAMASRALHSYQFEAHDYEPFANPQANKKGKNKSDDGETNSDQVSVPSGLQEER